MGLKRLGGWLGTMAALFAGGFLVVTTFAYATATAVTLDFAVSIGIVGIGLAMAGLAAMRGEIGQGALSIAIAAVAGWTIVATSVFAAPVAMVLGFASALAYVGISALSLGIREVTTDRVVHHLEVGEPDRARAMVG
jgi:hypothetical protein